ncbi:hypothetical protein G3O08_03070 [Cryomorpha ignava]|uniref:Uncharacterized protein n=1 Tax=Cryomorpha ignava TaxID=101383 RepID=A0A7K3WLG5_9FLAO|nr:hypothetical protein [Cryomorpha ignava]NEN22483.1 hypothetical protein [Cryomorpha ignava]
MKKDEIAVSIVSALFLVYISFISFDIYTSIALMIFIVSPVLIIFMVYSVLKHGEFKGDELDKGQEFGYLDRPKLGKPQSRDYAEQATFSY